MSGNGAVLPLKDQVAVVTGAGGGIGRGICTRLAEQGAIVYAADLDPAAARAVAQDLPAPGGAAHGALEMDVTDAESVDTAYSKVGARHGRIDIAVNNAGVSTMCTVAEMTERDWDFNLGVNAKGVFLCTRSQLRYMKSHGGRMVNTASVAGFKGAPLLAHYAASKFAVVGWTKSCALELARYGITVNCVCPGYVRTAMQDREVVWEAKVRGLTPEQVRYQYIDSTPMGRLCEPEDVANAVAFLVAPGSGFLTGLELVVSGGMEL